MLYYCSIHHTWIYQNMTSQIWHSGWRSSKICWASLWRKRWQYTSQHTCRCADCTPLSITRAGKTLKHQTNDIRLISKINVSSRLTLTVSHIQTV